MEQNKQLPALTRAIEKVGLQAIADACGVSYQAVRKWEHKGMPRTEWTGETKHAEKIAALAGEEVASKKDLLQRPKKQARTKRLRRKG